MPGGDSASLQAVQALSRAVRVLERASGELSLAHYRVLSAVAAGDERASRVAARLAIGKPTISATVQALCQRGFLVREEVAADQRAAALRLTPAGEAVLARTEATMMARFDELCAHTPDGQQLKECLAWLGGAIEAAAADRAQAPASQ